MTPDLVSSLVSTVGVVGALIWYLYYNTTKTIPELTKRYTDSTERIVQEFSETLKEERKHREQEIAHLQAWIRTEASCRYNEDHNK